MALTAIITYADVEAAERQTYSSAERVVLGTLVTLFDAYLKKNIIDWTYVSAGTKKTVFGCGSRYLYLPHWCAAITAISVDGDVLTSDELDDIVLEGYRLHRVAGTWPDGLKVEVTGTWGWDNSSDVPGDFKLICLDAFRSFWYQYTQRDTKSVSAGDYSETYSDVESMFGRSAVLRYAKAYYSGFGVV